MEHIKSFTEKWKDIFNYAKSFDNKSKNYLNAFKKSYEERTKSENILVECLYKLEFLESQDRRFLGSRRYINNGKLYTRR